MGSRHWIALVVAGVWHCGTALVASAQGTCKAEDFGAAVDAAGSALRAYNLEAAPKLQARMKALAGIKKWPDQDVEDTAIAYLQDERLSKLDETANALLAKVDTLGKFDRGEKPDCGRLDDLKAAGIELMAVMKAKSSYLVSKIDVELASKPQSTTAPAVASSATTGSGPAASPSAPTTAPLAPGRSVVSSSVATGLAEATAPPVPSAAPQPTPGPPSAAPVPVPTPRAPEGYSATTKEVLPPVARAPSAPAAAAETKATKPVKSPAWTATTAANPPPVAPPAGRPGNNAEIAVVSPPVPPEAQRPATGGGLRPSAPMTPPPMAPVMDDGYTIDEIRDATRGFFGTVSTSLAAVIEHTFESAGRPSGYILGQEGGGAFLGGLRYGDGLLYVRSGGTRKIFWHGPSVGFDVGAAGARTMFLIYKMREPDDLYRVFTGVDGSAFVVGGVGVTLLGGGGMLLAPIRSGLGVRVGANIGYLRFTPTQTWNPF